MTSDRILSLLCNVANGALAKGASPDDLWEAIRHFNAQIIAINTDPEGRRSMADSLRCGCFDQLLADYRAQIERQPGRLEVEPPAGSA